MEKPGSIRWEVAQVAIGLLLGVALCVCVGCESRIKYESKPTPEQHDDPTYQPPVDCYAVMFICRNCNHKWPQTFPLGEEWDVSECPLCKTNCGFRLKHQECYAEELGRE